MLPVTAPHADPAPETASAEAVWNAPSVRLLRVSIPVAAAAVGVACVAFADAAAARGVLGTQSLWWLGVLAIFVPAAATLLLSEVSRREAAVVLIAVGTALYTVKVLYAPGHFWEFDELLHYASVDSLLTTRHLFTPNSLLPVSPYYPGLETVTAVIVRLTGLGIEQAGLVVIGISHTLAVVGLFLLLERMAAPPRLTATATLLYMTCPAFLYFDSQFAYESLALALAIACLYALVAAQQAHRSRRRHLQALGAALLVAVILTHHVTSMILIIALLAWTVSDLLVILPERARRGEGLWFDAATGRPLVYARELPGGGWVPLLGIGAFSVWLAGVSWNAMSYLWPQVLSGLGELVRVVTLQETGRTLFQSNVGHSAPVLERVVGIGSVLAILTLIPFGVAYLWRQTEGRALARWSVIGALLYPVTLVLRLTRSGWEVGSRATAFVYLPLALVLAAGLYVVTGSFLRSRWRVLALTVGAAVLFAGGIVAVTSPVTRQPAPYDPGLAWVPYDAESLAAVRWAAATLGPGNRFAADSAGGTLLASVGRQSFVTSKGSDSISELFLTPGFDEFEKGIASRLHVRYVMADRRIAGTEPLKGYIYEKWEKDVRPYGSSVSSETVNKFANVHEANKIFDGGDVEFFDLGRVLP